MGSKRALKGAWGEPQKTVVLLLWMQWEHKQYKISVLYTLVNSIEPKIFVFKKLVNNFDVKAFSNYNSTLPFNPICG